MLPHRGPIVPDIVYLHIGGVANYKVRSVLQARPCPNHIKDPPLCLLAFHIEYISISCPRVQGADGIVSRGDEGGSVYMLERYQILVLLQRECRLRPWLVNYDIRAVQPRVVC